MEQRDDLLARIRQRMRELRLTQTALARFLGINQGNLSRRLSGKVPFTVSELARLDSLLGLSAPPGEREDPAVSLLTRALSVLSEWNRREFLLLAASFLEGKLQEPAKSQVCEALRLLAGETRET